MTARPTFVLLHSPLVGALTWRETATELGKFGYRSLVPSLAPALTDGPPYFPKLVERVREAVSVSSAKGDLVLVVHSSAGAIADLVADAIGVRMRAVVFVDAILPHPGRRWSGTVPTELVDRLRALEKGGVLPPWHEWFGADGLNAILPDDLLRSDFVAQLRPVPAAYLEEVLPDSRPPAHLRRAYVALSPAYQREFDEASAQGWPTARERLHHLAMLTHAPVVAELIVRLTQSLLKRA